MAKGDINQIKVNILVQKKDLLSFMQACQLIETGVEGLTEAGKDLVKQKAVVVYDDNGSMPQRGLANIQISLDLYLSYMAVGIMIERDLIK